MFRSTDDQETAASALLSALHSAVFSVYAPRVTVFLVTSFFFLVLLMEGDCIYWCARSAFDAPRCSTTWDCTAPSRPCPARPAASAAPGGKGAVCPHVKGKQYLCSLLFACCFGADSELMKAQAYCRPRTSTSFKHGFATGNNCQGGQCTPEVD